MMKLGSAHVSRGFGMMVILLSPLWFIGTVLMAIAVGHDLYHFSGELPIVLGLCAPAVYLIVRWAVPAITSRAMDSWAPAPVSEAAD
jgi:hypothetical protein